MNPLPDLTELAPQPDVYQDQHDNFLTLFGDLTSEHDSLLDLLASQASDANAGLDPISSTIDEVDGALNDLITAFDLLSKDLLEVDLSLVIADAQKQDNDLENNLDSWLPDLGIIGDLFAGILQNFISDFIGPFLNDLESQIGNLFNSILTVEAQSCGPCSPTPIYF